MLTRSKAAGTSATVGLLAVLAASPGAGQSIFDDRGSVFSFGGVGFPSVVDTFAVMHVLRYPTPSLGVTMQYSTPLDRTARIDVYVYTGEATPGLGRDERLRGEFDLAVRGMVEYARQNPRAFRIVEQEERSVTVDDATGESHDGWQLEASVVERGVEQTSFLYLFSRGDYFLKYRISFATSLESTMRTRADAFLEETLADVSVDQ